LANHTAQVWPIPCIAGVSLPIKLQKSLPGSEHSTYFKCKNGDNTFLENK